MNKVAFPLIGVLWVSLIACGGKGAPLPQPKPVPSEAEDFCIADTRVKHGIDPSAVFCETRGSDPKLEKRMTETIVGAGADVRRFSLRCRADICSVTCVTVPREQCVDELHRVVRWSAPQLIFDAIEFQDRRGQWLFRIRSKDYVESLSGRRELLSRIARRLRDSQALESCKQNANAHGLRFSMST